MTDEQHFDAALATVYNHHGETRHGLKFLLCLFRLEFACPRCGEVLYEGSAFHEDGGRGWQRGTLLRNARS